MSTLSGYGVADSNHVAMFSNFLVLVSVIIFGWVPSTGYEGLNHHNVGGNGGPDIGTSS